MRRRSKHAPNTSESTGKIGQELPSDQPAPLVPFYPDEQPVQVQQARPPRTQEARHQEARRPESDRRPAEPHPAAPVRPARPERPARIEWSDPVTPGRFELETQPEMPSAAPPAPPRRGRPPPRPPGARGGGPGGA